MQKLYTTIILFFGVFTSFNLVGQVYIADSNGVFQKKNPVAPVKGKSLRGTNANNTIPSSQDPTNLFPPSPTAAALARYGDIPVGYHTGTPNISVPLYELKSKELSLPISLSYHASGIKVYDVSSWVGLGWSLNAGGVITRTVQSLPDDGAASSGDGYYSRPTKTFVFGRGCAPIAYFGVPRPPTYNFPLELCGDGRTQTSQQAQAVAQTQQNWEHAESGLIDMEPDIFFFNIGGFSGKFMFDSTGAVRLFPEQNIKVVVTHDAIARRFKQFKLIMPDGTKYYFGGTHGDPNFTQGDPAVEATANQASYPYETSWFLTKIVSANEKSKLFFRYKSEEYGYYDVKNEYLSTESFSAGSFPPPDYGIEKNKINGVRLSHIYTSDKNTQIEFFTNTRREDVSHITDGDVSGGVPISVPINAYKLDEVRILNGSGAVFKKFKFEHDYFVSTGNPNFPELGGGADGFTKDRKRLKLVRVTEMSGDGSVVLPPYQFEYNSTINVPRRISFGRDHWGYYNGKEYYNRSLIHVQMNGGDGVSVGAPYIVNASPFKASDRTSVAAYVGFASLEKITYPTGGYTTFTYGTHLAGSMTTPVGGLRIASIKNYEGNGNLLNQKDFDYNFSGKLFSIPTYYYQARISLLMWDIIRQGLGLPPVVGNGGDVKDIASSSPVLPLSTTQGSHIGYSSVRVRETGNGSTVYTYNVGNGYPYPGGGIPGKYDVFGVERLFNYPRDLIKEDYNLGQLEKEEVFNNNDVLISETINTYSYDEAQINIPAIKVDANSINSYQISKMYNRYAFFTGRSDLTGKRVRTCDVNGTNCVTNNSTFAYDGTNTNGRIKHFQMTSRTTEASNGDLIISETKYAQDYVGSANDAGGLSLAALRDSNMVVPVETNKIRRKATNDVESVLSGEITFFEPTMLKPSYNYILETLAPVVRGSFTFSNITGNAFIKDSKYTANAAQYITYYTGSGNTKEIYTRQGSNQVVTYLWGYNHALPIAEIKNATYTAIVGLLGQTTIDNLAVSSSYTDANLRATLNPILGITNSLATIYTYNPIIGITSTTAPSGLVTYYNYDALGRLINIKDHNEKIVKSYQYGYAIATSTSIDPNTLLPNVLGPCGLINVKERADIIDSGQTLTDEACQEVILKEGFHAKSGSEYVAKPKS